MKRIVFGLAVFLLVSQCVCAGNDPLGGLKVLEGYSVRHFASIDTLDWTIEKKGGLKIRFEAGPSEGSAVDPADRSKYSWYREQQVNGYKVRFALVKRGSKTQWEPDDSRGLPPGNILLVTFLLGGHTDHAANFVAKLANSQELADALLMVMTFDPDKGVF